MEIFPKFAWKNRFYLPGSKTPYISNQIDAAGIMDAIIFIISIYTRHLSHAYEHLFKHTI